MTIKNTLLKTTIIASSLLFACSISCQPTNLLNHQSITTTVQARRRNHKSNYRHHHTLHIKHSHKRYSLKRRHTFNTTRSRKKHSTRRHRIYKKHSKCTKRYAKKVRHLKLRHQRNLSKKLIRSHKRYRHSNKPKFPRYNTSKYEVIHVNGQTFYLNTMDNVGPTDTKSINKNLKEMKSQTLTDINEDREQNGLEPYQESNSLDKIAGIRAKQDSQHPNSKDPHVDPNTGDDYFDEVSQNLGQNYPEGAENCAASTIGVRYNYEDPKVTYNPQNGKEMANDTNDVLMNYDQDEDNGHRNNILNSDLSYMGVGTAYNSSNMDYYLVEDFA